MPLLRELESREPRETWPSLQKASECRYDDGLALYIAGRHMGAVYLWGYVAELLLKVAYCRLAGVPPSAGLMGVAYASRQGPIYHVAHAPDTLVWRGRNLHDVAAWARFLVELRERMGLPMDAAVGGALALHALRIAENWSESIRYSSAEAGESDALAMHESVEFVIDRFSCLWR